MEIKIIKRPLKKASTTIIPYYYDKDVKNTAKDLHKEYMEWFPSLSKITKYPDAPFIVSGSRNTFHNFIFIDAEKTKNTWHWVARLKGFLANLSGEVQVDLRNPDVMNSLPMIVQAFILSTYQTGRYKTKDADEVNRIDKLHLILSKDTAVEAKKVVGDSVVITKHQIATMDLVNGPGNKVHAPYLSKWIRRVGKEVGMKVKVLTRKQIESEKLAGLMAVNRGSEWDPAFIIAEYFGSDKPAVKTIGLVGKGVTFDTGGLSIKGSNNMHYMKSDMGGAAAVLGTISAIAELKWPINAIAIAPITDNCVDAKSIKPGDVIDTYSGKTVEVINTDAEGRLILADGLSYMVKNYDVDHLIDLATLTGSSVRTFGTACAALFSNDEELEEQLFISGLDTGEKLWSLPIWDEYFDEMKSDIADIKNLSTRPMAGAITAAKFLQFFTHDHPSWAHLDIAGMAFGDTKLGRDKNATGYGVQLLCHFIKEYLLH